MLRTKIPLLTIITVCYNSAATIEETIKSVLAQTFTDYEYIIIDGKSTDGTVDIIKKYEHQFCGRLSYVSEKDTGIYNAMNKGIKKAKGEWIHILNSDDIYSSYEILSDIFVKQQRAKCYHIDWLIYSVLFKNRILHPQRLKSTLIIHHQGIFIKRQFYSENGFYNENFRIFSDSVYMNTQANKAKYIVSDLIAVNMGHEGISTKISYLRSKEYFILLIHYHKYSLLIKFWVYLSVFTRLFHHFVPFIPLSSNCRPDVTASHEQCQSY